jgi:hypothetical protein
MILDLHPMDDFRSANEQRILQARTGLAASLRGLTGATAAEAWMDHEHPFLILD